MEDPKWLRLITIGLVLAAIAVGYFLFTGRFASNSTKQKISQTAPSASPTSAPGVVSATPTPSVLGQNSQTSPTPTPVTAFNRIAERTKGGQRVQTLPRTGFPVGLVVALSASTVIIGWGLRRFPH